MPRRISATFALATAAAALATAQPQFSDAVRTFIKVDAPVVALTNVRVIDGTGAPARANQTVIIKGGNIEAIGDSASVSPPQGATTLDLAGRSVIPGLVMVHEHLYYPDRSGRLRSARRELHPPLPRRRRDDDAHRRQRERLHGPEAEAADRRRAEGRSCDRRHGAVPERPEHVLADARPEGCRRCAAAGGVLGRRGRDVVQGLHADHAARSCARRSTRRTSAA